MSILYVDEIRSKDPNSSNKIDLSGTSVSLQHDEPTADIAVSVADLNTATTPLILPAGMIATFAIITAPTGWLICDGSAINRTTYARLYSAISETWGPGDSYSSFNVPDLRGAYLRNTGTSLVDANYVGPAVGSSQSDQITLHEHSIWQFSGTGGAWSSNAGGGTHPSSNHTQPTRGGQTGNTGNEVRVYNYGVQYCIKY